VVISSAGDKVVKIRTFELNNYNEHTFKDKLEMKEIGPSLDLKLRKVKLATDEVYKLACRQPKMTSRTKSKNEVTNVQGEKRGRVYMTSQDLNKMSLKQYNKQLKKKISLRKKKETPEGTEPTTDKPKKEKKRKKTKKELRWKRSTC